MIVLLSLEKFIAHYLIAQLKTGKLRDIIILEGIINDLLQKVGIKICKIYIF